MKASDITVTFDFDQTLQRPEVQAYAWKLLDRGVDVWILTARYGELHKHLWKTSPCNKDLYAVADSIGLDRHKILFTNMMPKSSFLKDSCVLWHLDDLQKELAAIKGFTNVCAVDSLSGDWEVICDNLIDHAILTGWKY